jgi:hypothetical protein
MRVARPDGESVAVPAEEPARAGGSARTFLLLLLVTALSFALRFGAVGRLLPVHPEPDSSLSWVYRSMMGEAIYHPEQHLGVYPDLLPRLLTLVTGPMRTPAPDASLEEHLAAASAPYLRMRILIAAIASLAAPVVFLLARRFWSDVWACACAMFVATGLLHLAHSSVGKAHGAETTFAWLTILLALRQLEKPSVARVIATAVAAVLAIGTIQIGFFVLPAMFAAALFARSASSPARIAAWVAPFAAAAGGLEFIPGGVHFGPWGVRMGFGHRIHFTLLDGRGLPTWLRLFWEHDPVLAVLSGLGLFLLLRELPRAWRDPVARSRELVIAAFVLSYGTVISLDAHVVDRYIMPLYPGFALLSTLAARAIFEALRGRVPRTAVCALLLALPTWIAVRYTWIGRRATTLQQLGSWIEAQPGATGKKFLLAPSVSPPIFPQPDSLARQLTTSTGRSQPWFEYLGKLPRLPSRAPTYALDGIDQKLYVRKAPLGPEDYERYFTEQAPDFVVLEVTKRMAAFPGEKFVRELVRRRGERVGVFSGEGGRHPGQIPIDYQGVRDLAVRVLSADAFGPHLEVYRWRGP